MLRRTLVISGGFVVPVDGEPIDGGTVVVQDGTITAVGADVAAPQGEQVRHVDATGSWVLPGFIEAHAHMGVHEDGEGWSGDDTNERTDPVGARFRALDAINPDDEGFRDALGGGVTSAVVKPGSANPIGGQTAAVKTWGRVVDEMVFRDPVSVKSALGENPKRVYGEQQKTPSTRQGVAAVIRGALARAEDYRERRVAARQEGKPFDRDQDSEVLTRVLGGELVWDQHTHRADDIATAIRLSEEFGYRLVVNHGTEAHLFPDLLAERGIPAIVGPLFTTRSKVELRQRTLAGPGRLAAAGVRVAITTDHPVIPIHFLVHQATLAIKEGMDRREAMRALTVNPARILGLDDRVGALRPGLDGDVVLWSGDPLDVFSRAQRVFVEGREVYQWDEEAGAGVVTDPFAH